MSSWFVPETDHLVANLLTELSWPNCFFLQGQHEPDGPVVPANVQQEAELELDSEELQSEDRQSQAPEALEEVIRLSFWTSHLLWKVVA